jgi:hypothetical protein
MRLARFIVGIGFALVMAYIAAALDVGSHEADAHLCELAASGALCHDKLGTVVFWTAIIMALIVGLAVSYDGCRWACARFMGQEYTPLLQAALFAHDRISDHIVDVGRATYAGNDPDRILEWWGYLFAPKLVIFGKRAPSRVREVYSDRKHRNDYDLSKEGERIVAKERDGNGLWSDLEVKTRELKRLVRRLRNEHGDR